MRLFFVGVLAVLIGTGVAIVAAEMTYDPNAGKNQAKKVTVTSFAECVAAGYPIFETYPRSCRTPKGQSFAEELSDASSAIQAAADTQAAALLDLIRPSAPSAGATVQSPISISGTARGDWYFNAAFPVELVDATGQTIATGEAKASGEWITHEFVPFSASLSFPSPAAGTRGTLVLRRGSWSDTLNVVKIPVQF